MKLNEEALLIVALGGIGAVLLVSIFKNAKALGYTVGQGAVDLADGVVSGTVTGIGEAVGIPKTNLSDCERAKAEGRTWDASFACPAGDFLNYWWNR